MRQRKGRVAYSVPYGIAPLVHLDAQVFQRAPEHGYREVYRLLIRVIRHKDSANENLAYTVRRGKRSVNELHKFEVSVIGL